ncbi:MAG: polysaccharide biosynthesis C-terminal domain-containing protein [Lutimonas sp.]
MSAFIFNFLSRKGAWVFSSMVIGKLLTFLSSWIALQLLDQDDLGNLLFALNIVLFFIPISGFGGAQGLLRYGALEEKKGYEQNLLHEVIKKGFIFSSILIGIIIILSEALTANMPDSRLYLMSLSLLILTLFFLESIKTYYRVIGKNEIYAKIEITYAFILLFLVAIGCYFYGIWGYLLSLVLTPLLTLILYLPKNIFTGFYSEKQLLKADFWKYSFFTGLSNSVTQLLAIADIFLIGYLLQDPAQVTYYKYLSLIPLSLVIFPNAFITTDFVSLTSKIDNQHFIFQYIKQYILFFLLAVSLFWIIQLYCIDPILNFFGKDFIPYKKVYYFLLFGVTAVIMLRILFGNLLSALGMAKINFWIAGFSVILNVLLNLYFIPSRGILGAAITSAITMWISSFLSLFCFYYYLKKLRK